MNRIEWNCCGSVTETEHKPETCPFCNELEKGSKVSREHYEALERERDELVARVKCLEQGLDHITDVASECNGWESFPMTPLDDALEALNSSPRQSLARIKAEALESEADRLDKNAKSWGREICDSLATDSDFLRIQAAKLREGE